MPCDNVSHVHVWPASGALTIERCEVFCQYCSDDADRKHRHKFAWFLRRHVDGVHIKKGKGSHPDVRLAKGWTGMPEGSKGLKGNAERGPRRNRNKKALSLSRSPSPPSFAQAYSVTQPQVIQGTEAVAAYVKNFIAAQSSGNGLSLAKNTGIVAPAIQQPSTSDSDPHSSGPEFLSDNNFFSGLNELPNFSNLTGPTAHFNGVYADPKDIFVSQPYQGADAYGLTANVDEFANLDGSTGLGMFGYDTSGFDNTGFNNTGFDSTGYDTTGLENTGIVTPGLGITGLDNTVFDTPGLNTTGINTTGINTTGIDTTGINTTVVDTAACTTKTPKLNPAPITARHTMPPLANTNSSDSTTSLTSVSPHTTPQRRIGLPIEMEMPLTPLSLSHANWLRERMNDITGTLASFHAKEGVMAWGVTEYGQHLVAGVAY
ncbi:hypothetical protein LTR91_007367 [Friedmanniomyces endolithicus]|uniref:Uncharacterized protein n=1 Tax=Friedmanniomyces endolithicus TaxID=329885 RepID=A0AAN6KQ53_9PEZI|nr:hypothetical protein LTR57_006277 [Friedmanniomyces endolithicus]KAK0995176.1 hypothetical protein LTR91_007367 [Friedmanniomyces endolithicus]KAK0995255.1 hypothetical protein LTS01_006758 [Friedmanniomyces endolithicus]KAK1047531.1 hypothetical protein LTS16_004991 [Friedmanniomyces endolithicus]